MMRFLPAVLFFAAATTALAQKATPEQRGSFPVREDYSVMHLTTNIGSFKILNAEGKFDFTLRGSVMINRYEGKPLIIQGNLQTQYKGNNRIVVFGTGRIVLEGKWRGMQWFGRDMKAVWYGKGIARLTGEFDKNLETGWFWYEDANDKNAWSGQGSFDIPNPPRKNQTATPRARDEIKSRGKKPG